MGFALYFFRHSKCLKIPFYFLFTSKDSWALYLILGQKGTHSLEPFLHNTTPMYVYTENHKHFYYVFQVLKVIAFHVPLLPIPFSSPQAQGLHLHLWKGCALNSESPSFRLFPASKLHLGQSQSTAMDLSSNLVNQVLSLHAMAGSYKSINFNKECLEKLLQFRSVKYSFHKR
jgi:hypothetical protein